MKEKYLVYLLLISFLLFSKEVTAKTIHMILVADTVNEAEFTTRPDMQAIQYELKNFAKHAQMPIKEKIFSGSEFQKKKVESYLMDLKADPSDTIVFYFSGHGYRTQGQKTPWPCLNFEFYKPGIDLKWVSDTIRTKKAQFNLIIADCCNNFIERGFVNNESKFIRLNLYCQNPHYQGYKSLFLNAKGSVIVCSSSVGQFSYGSKMGGLFTQCLLNSLNQESCQATPNWKRLLERASSYIKHIQKPICEIYQ